MKHIRYIEIACNRSGEGEGCKTRVMMNLEKTLILAVKGMAELFEKKECVGVKARMLTLCRNLLENLVDICHIEIAT